MAMTVLQVSDTELTLVLPPSTLYPLDATIVGAGGIDAGVLEANKRYYVFYILRENIVDGEVEIPTYNTLLSLSRTAPTLPAGYTSFQLASPWFTDGSAHLIPARSTGGWFFYDTPQVIDTGLNSTTFAELDASDFISASLLAPLLLQLAMTPNTAGNKAIFRAAQSSGIGFSSQSAPLAGLNTLQSMIISDAGLFDYKVTEASDSLDVSLAAFGFS